MADIVISGDSSGSITLRAPAVSGTTILTMPTTSGTLVTTAGGSTVPFALGSAAAPSITFTGDTNTGMFSPGADTIAFSEGGVESMRIDSGGNLLVGTTSIINTERLAVVRSSTVTTDPFVGGAITVALKNTSNTAGNSTSIENFDAAGGNSYIRFINVDQNYAGAITFGTASAGAATFGERMRIDPNGQVIVGPFGGNGNAVVAGSSSPGFTNQPGTNLLLKSGDGSGTGSSFMSFSTSPVGSSGTTVNTAVERMRIDSSGNVGIAKTSLNPWDTNTNGVIQLGNRGAAIFGAGTNFTGGAALYQVNNAYFDNVGWKYATTNPSAFYEQQNNVHIWSIAASGTAGNAISWSERMRITSTGYVAIGTSTNSDHPLLIASGTSDYALSAECSHPSNPGGVEVRYTATAPNNSGAFFFLASDTGATRAQIRSNGGLANFSANNVNLSDERTKKDIQLAGSYLDKICAIPVKTFLYKDQTDTDLNLGVIAQDVEAVAPELVNNDGFGETPEDGLPLKTIYQTDLQYALMKAIQELNAKVTALEAQLGAK
jgi:hypothetical protein